MSDEHLITVLRALYWYEDKLTNQCDDVRDPDEWDRVVWTRRELKRELEKRAYL